MKIWNEHPENSFWETGFWFATIPNWRYTGKYGLVYHNIPWISLPAPYGDTESIPDVLLMFPYYLLAQIKETFGAFGKNLVKFYADDGSLREDALSIPLALVDFLPATALGVASVLAPVGLILLPLIGSIFEVGRGTFKPIVVLYGLLASIFLSPLLAAVGALLGVVGLINSALMFVKAAVETSLAVLTTVSIPFKGIALGVSSLASKFRAWLNVEPKDIAQEAVPEVATGLAAMGGKDNAAVVEPVAPAHHEGLYQTKVDNSGEATQLNPDSGAQPT